MIQEVDQALEALVRREALNGSRVEVMFDAPTKDWVARRNAPTLDIYLYDIREDVSRRQIVPELMRDAGTGIAGERRMPPRRFRLSYMVTAWTQRPEDEHRLLATCLATFVRNETIPADLLAGSLAGSPYPVIVAVGMPLGPDRSIADVWSAMGGELKPSLDLVVIAPLDASWSWPVAAPVMEGPTLGVGGPGLDPDRRSRRGGGSVRAGARALRPDDDARQSELVMGGPGVRSTAGTTQPASGTGIKGADERAARAVPGEVVEPELASLGRGRIVKIRGIPRP
jgi:hypothetical protein